MTQRSGITAQHVTHPPSHRTLAKPTDNTPPPLSLGIPPYRFHSYWNPSLPPGDYSRARRMPTPSSRLPFNAYPTARSRDFNTEFLNETAIEQHQRRFPIRNHTPENSPESLSVPTASSTWRPPSPPHPHPPHPRSTVLPHSTSLNAFQYISGPRAHHVIESRDATDRRRSFDAEQVRLKARQIVNSAYAGGAVWQNPPEEEKALEKPNEELRQEIKELLQNAFRFSSSKD